MYIYIFIYIYPRNGHSAKKKTGTTSFAMTFASTNPYLQEKTQMENARAKKQEQKGEPTWHKIQWPSAAEEKHPDGSWSSVMLFRVAYCSIV